MASITPESSSAERIWHVKVGGKKIGPLNDEEFCGLALSGKIKSRSLAWKHGMQDWLPCASIPELVRLFPSRSGWALKNPIPAIARKITRRHLAVVGAAALVVGAIWAWRTYIYVPPYDDFVSVFATQTNGAPEEFAKVEKHADLYFYIPKQTGRWGDAEPLHQMDKKELSELFGQDWKQTQPLGLVGRNGQTAILRVKQGWATDNFQCTTGYFVMRPSGPIEVSKAETRTLALPSLAPKKPEPTAAPSGVAVQDAQTEPIQDSGSKQAVALVTVPEKSGGTTPLGQPTPTPAQTPSLSSPPEKTLIVAGEDNATSLTKRPEPTPSEAAIQDAQVKPAQDDGSKQEAARVTVLDESVATSPVEQPAPSQTESRASTQKKTPLAADTSDDQLRAAEKSQPTPATKSVAEKKTQPKGNSQGADRPAPPTEFVIQNAKDTMANRPGTVARRTPGTTQGKPAPTPVGRPVVRQQADNKAAKANRPVRPGGVSLLGGLVHIDQAPARTPASGKNGQKLLPVPQRPGEAVKVPDGSQSGQNGTPPPARPAPSPTPDN